MKKLLLIFLIPFVIKAQLINLFSNNNVPEYFALDLDGSTEYAYINNPTGLDLNSANYLSGSDADFTDTFNDQFDVDNWYEVTANVTYDAVNDRYIWDGLQSSAARLDRYNAIDQTANQIYFYAYYVDSISAGNTRITINGKSSDYVPTSGLIIGYVTSGASPNGHINLTGDVDFTGSITYCRVWKTNWQGLTYTGTKATFSDTASISQSNLSSAMEHGKNYTVQLKAKSDGILGSDLLSGWDFTSGWSNSLGNSTIDDSNSFTSINNGYGVQKQVFTVGFYYKVHIVGTTTSAGGMKTVNSNGGTTPLICETTSSGAFDINGIILATSAYIYLRNTNSGTTDISTITIEPVTYSDLKVKVGNDSTTHTTTGTETTYAYTFTYDSTGYGATGNPIQLIGNGTDTYTIDDVDVSEAYDLDIDLWMKYSVAAYRTVFATNGSYTSGGGYRLGRFTSDNKIQIQIYNNNNNPTVLSSSSTFSSGTWYNVKFNFDNLTKIAKVYVNNNLEITSSANYWTYTNRVSVLRIGVDGASVSNFYNGQIGTISFTRTNGLGETVSTSIYDWEGTADTFLDDKGTNGNDLTGVNTTIDDQVKYKGAYK